MKEEEMLTSFNSEGTIVKWIKSDNKTFLEYK